jgi:hypothetical protein
MGKSGAMADPMKKGSMGKPDTMGKPDAMSKDSMKK